MLHLRSILILSCLTSSACYAQSSSNICSIYKEHADFDKPLIDRYNQDKNDNSGENEVRKDAAIDDDKKLLEQDFSKRNDEIYFATHAGKIKNLPLIVDKVEASTEDFGNGSGEFASIETHLDCDYKVSVSLPNIPVNAHWKPILSKLNTNDTILISGKLNSHDIELQRPADAVQWAGPLWGIFGTLREEALLEPSLQITLQNLTIK